MNECRIYFYTYLCVCGFFTATPAAMSAKPAAATAPAAQPDPVPHHYTVGALEEAIELPPTHIWYGMFTLQAPAFNFLLYFCISLLKNELPILLTPIFSCFT